MATFRKRSGSWQALVKKKGFGQIARTFDSKAEAEVWAREIEAEMDRGVFVSRKEAESTTLFEALERYSREITSAKKGAKQEMGRIRHWMSHPLSKRFLATIQGKDVAAYRDERLRSGISANSVRLELAVISHLFTIAVKEWGMGGLVNPVMQIRKPKLPQGRDRRLLPGELDRILTASDSPALPDLVRFAIETAMRRSELSGMTWDRVDLKKRTATLLDTKNGEKRIVSLSGEAVRILSGLTRRIEGAVWGMEPDSITQAFNRAVSRARLAYENECQGRGIKPDPSYLTGIRFHDLRHEATSRLFELGLDASRVQKITGHKTYAMLSRYTHLKAEDIAQEMDLLQKARSRKAVKGEEGAY